MAFIKSCSIDSRNEQSPTCEVVHETNKAHFRNLLPIKFLSSSVGRTLEWCSGGCGFQPHWGQFLTKLILFCVTLDLSDNLIETHIVKNSIVTFTGILVTNSYLLQDQLLFRLRRKVISMTALKTIRSKVILLCMAISKSGFMWVFSYLCFVSFLCYSEFVHVPVFSLGNCVHTFYDTFLSRKHLMSQCVHNNKSFLNFSGNTTLHHLQLFMK